MRVERLFLRGLIEAWHTSNFVSTLLLKGPLVRPYYDDVACASARCTRTAFTSQK